MTKARFDERTFTFCETACSYNRVHSPAIIENFGRKLKIDNRPHKTAKFASATLIIALDETDPDCSRLNILSVPTPRSGLRSFSEKKTVHSVSGVNA